MSETERVPLSINAKIPNAARIQDYLLGGQAHFAADREAADRVLAVAPLMPVGARLQRDFLRRAVRLMADSGIDQFIDIGTGLPTMGNVHQVADPGARVVYVDNDPMVVTHARALRPNSPTVTTLLADLRDPDDVLRDAAKLIDFSRPVGLIMIAVLHFIPDDDAPHPIVRHYLDALAPGSWFVATHGHGDIMEKMAADALKLGSQIFEAAGIPLAFRDRDDILRFFDGVERVEPGLVSVLDWRPDKPVPAAQIPNDERRQALLAGAGRKPTEGEQRPVCGNT